MKLLIGYMKEDSEAIENGTVIVDEFTCEDGIELPNIVAWYYKLAAELPEGYTNDDIVIQVQ